MSFTDHSRLTQEEEAKCLEAFSTFDIDQSGTIDAHELNIVLEMMGCRASEADVHQMIGSVNSFSNGQITYA
jgi:Ca2+-binding EF-hand superfamily protein